MKIRKTNKRRGVLMMYYKGPMLEFYDRYIRPVLMADDERRKAELMLDLMQAHTTPKP